MMYAHTYIHIIFTGVVVGSHTHIYVHTQHIFMYSYCHCLTHTHTNTGIYMYYIAQDRIEQRNVIICAIYMYFEMENVAGKIFFKRKLTEAL